MTMILMIIRIMVNDHCDDKILDDDDPDLDALVAGVDADHEADEHLCPIASQEAGEEHPDQT